MSATWKGRVKMPTRRKTWVYVPPKKSKPTVTETVKADVEAKSRALVESVLKPLHIKSPPDDDRVNYIVDIDTKWYRGYFYFFATYRCPGPTAMAPTFEAKFARLEYTGADRFDLAFLRHTGQWVEPYDDLPLEQCLEAIRDDHFFIP